MMPFSLFHILVFGIFIVTHDAVLSAECGGFLAGSVWSRIPVPAVSYNFDSGLPKDIFHSPVTWDGEAYDGTGAIRVEKEGYIVIPPSTTNLLGVPLTNRGLAIRLVVMLPASPFFSSTIFDFYNAFTGSSSKSSSSSSSSSTNISPAGSDSIRLSVVGTQRTMADIATNRTRSLNQNDLMFRVINTGKSCEQSSRGCDLDLPNFFQAGIWYDLLININTQGVAQLYNNATLVAETKIPFKYKPSSYIMKVGQIQAGATPSLTNCDDKATLILRSIDIYNVSLTSTNIRDIYTMTTEKAKLEADLDRERYSSLIIANSDSNLASIDCNPLYNEPFYVSSAQTPVWAQSYLYSFNSRKLIVPRPVDGTQELFLKGNATYQMDVMDTPNINGILLPDNNSYIQLPNMTIGGPFSMRFTFSHHPNAYLNSTIIFACSSINNRTESNRIALSTVGTSTSLLEFTITNGDGYVYPGNMSVNTNLIMSTQRLVGNLSIADSPQLSASQNRDYSRFYDILVVVDIFGKASMYNQGILIGSAIISVPFLDTRSECYLGRDTFIPFNRKNYVDNYLNNWVQQYKTVTYTTNNCASYCASYSWLLYCTSWETVCEKGTRQVPISPPNASAILNPILPTYHPFQGAIGLFNYVPYALDDNTVASMMMNRTSAESATPTSPVAPDWSSYIWSFVQPFQNTLTLDQETSSLLRYGATWQSIEPDTEANVTGTLTSSTSTVLTSGLSTFSSVVSGGGGIFCSSGGYMNLGSTYFGGDLTLQIKFRLLDTLVTGSAVFDIGNSLTAPKDHFRLIVGKRNNATADAVLQSYQAGSTLTCPNKWQVQADAASTGNCGLVLPGILHVGRDTDLIVVVSAGVTSVYVDGVLLSVSRLLYSPLRVIRPYTFLARSYDGVKTSMHIYSFSITTKPLTTMDVSSISPPKLQIYNYQFLDEPNSNNFTKAATGIGSGTAVGAGNGATSGTGGGATSGVSSDGYQFHGSYSLFSSNPFALNLSLPHLSDDTSSNPLFPKPTKGLFFNNQDPLTLQSDIDEAIRQWNHINKTLLPLKRGELYNINHTQASLKIHYDELLANRSALIAPYTGNMNPEDFDVIIPDEAIRNQSNEYKWEIRNTAEWQATNLTRMQQLQQEIHDLELQLQQLNIDLEIKNRTSANAIEPAYVSFLPFYLGGPFSLRLKFRVGYDIPVNQNLTILDISSVDQTDALLVTASGNQSSVVVTISVGRGSLVRSFPSTPMDASRYWLDLIFKLDNNEAITIYNWGNVNARGNLWLPVPGWRTHAAVGKSNTKIPQFLKRTAFSILQFFPTLLTATAISDIYTYDHPPVARVTKDGVWSVVNTSLVTSFLWRPPYDAVDNCNTCQGGFRPNKNCEVECCTFEQWPTANRGKHLTATLADSVKPFPNFVAFPEVGRGKAEYDTEDNRKGKLPDGKTYTTDWAYWNYAHNPLGLVATPYLNYGEAIEAYLAPSNRFTDVTLVTSDASYIQNILYYEPALLEYNNRAEVSQEEKKVNPTILDLGVIDRNVSNAFNKLADHGKVLFISPPQIMFQYAQTSTNIPQPEPSAGAANIPTSLPGFKNAQDWFKGDRFRTDARAIQDAKEEAAAQKAAGSTSTTPTTDKDKTPEKPLPQWKTFTLAPNERIITVKSKCNYRFTFITNHGRKLIIGDYDFLDKVTQCYAPIQFQSDIDMRAATPVKYPIDFVSNGAGTSTTVVDPLEVSEGPEGYSLSYMEGTRGGMFAWRWHWTRTPLSYRMYNLVFDLDASSSIAGGTPSQAIAVDLYNHSPIQQQVSAIHTLSISEEKSFHNTDTKEQSWSRGVTFDVSVFGVSVGGSFGSGNSNSISTTYGSSSTTSQEDTQMLIAAVPPYSKITATLLVFTGTVDIPYTADIEITYHTGAIQHVITHGIFNHVKTSSIIVTYSDAQPISNSTPLGS